MWEFGRKRRGRLNPLFPHDYIRNERTANGSFIGLGDLHGGKGIGYLTLMGII
jgi:hypothetical protein